MADFTFEIVKHLATLETSSSGWTTELNSVKWGDRDPVYDIRSWSPDHMKCSKGTTLSPEAFSNLCDYFRKN